MHSSFRALSGTTKSQSDHKRRDSQLDLPRGLTVLEPQAKNNFGNSKQLPGHQPMHNLAGAKSYLKRFVMRSAVFTTPAPKRSDLALAIGNAESNLVE